MKYLVQSVGRLLLFTHSALVVLLTRGTARVRQTSLSVELLN